VESKYNKIIKFTKELVRIPSQSGIDGEKNVASVVFDKLAGFGFKPRIIGQKAHPSVICQVGKGRGKIVWLESCLDTAPAGDKKLWDYPPFAGKTVGNKMFGRGAADSKVGIALFCYLARELNEDKDFNGSLFLGFDADEQSGNFTGIGEIIKKAPKTDVCVLGYQGMDEISIGARGWLRLKLTTRGLAAHTGSRSQKGVNAIHLMARATAAITEIKLEVAGGPFFEFGPALNFAQISGGTAINVVPDKCVADIDIRLLPGQTKDKIIGQITRTLEELKTKNRSPAYDLEILQFEPAYLTNPEDDFIRIISARAREILHKQIPLAASGQGSVGNVISQLGMPVINAFGCASGNVHAPNEWIDIGTIAPVFEIYKKAIIEYCQ